MVSDFMFVVGLCFMFLMPFLFWFGLFICLFFVCFLSRERRHGVYGWGGELYPGEDEGVKTDQNIL